jgi:Xaa-Pro aminopeptidase
VEQIQSEVIADKKIIGKGLLIEFAAKEKLFHRLKKIGFEKDHLSVSEFEELEKAIGKKRLLPVQHLVENLRAVKDAEEIALLSKAIEISDSVFKKILGILKPGVSELDISAEISYLHKKLGAEGDAFEVIAASGERGALPHGRASEKKIASDEFVTLDFGCVYRGYHSDMTRTVVVGKPSEEMKKVYQIVLEAQRKAADSVKEKISAKKVDSIARNVIASHGYGKYFGHSLGHGVGLEIHEQLRLSQTSKNILQSGNTVTIEPGIYLPRKFGVRIEDIIVVRNNGAETLTLSPKELIVL